MGNRFRRHQIDKLPPPESKLTGPVHPSNPARQQQQGHPQQTQSKAVERLGFAGSLRSAPAEFIRLVERGVNAPTLNVNR